MKKEELKKYLMDKYGTVKLWQVSDRIYKEKTMIEYSEHLSIIDDLINQVEE